MTDPIRFGRYTVTRVLGRGAMGVVYHAEDPVISREVEV
jgi:serine/threonine protein kinase